VIENFGCQLSITILGVRILFLAIGKIRFVTGNVLGIAQKILVVQLTSSISAIDLVILKIAIVA